MIGSATRYLGAALALLGLLPPALGVQAATPRVGSGGACAGHARIHPRGVIRYSDWQFPTTLNPVQTNLASATLTGELQNDDLVRYDQRGRLYPLLLRRVPTIGNGGISKNGKTIHLYLKHGVRWSNGATVTAHQIWFAWKVSMDPLSGPACRGTCDTIASISTPNKYEAVLHMRQVYASAVPRALPGVLIERWQSPAGGWTKDNSRQAAYELYQDSSFSYTGPDFPTNGPYQVTSYKRDSRIVLQPNRYYNDMSCGARVAKLIFTSYRSKQAMIAAAAAHKIDISQNYHLADLHLLRRYPGAYRIYDMPAFVYEHLELNTDARYGGHANPLANRNVRLALALAVNKVGMIEHVLRVSPALARLIVAYNMWIDRPSFHQPFTNTSVSGQWDPIAHRYVTSGSARAVRDARRLIRATRWKHGVSLDAHTTRLYYRTRALSYIARDWSRLGIRLRIKAQSAGTLLGSWDENGTLDHGRFQVALFAWVGSPDPDSWRNELAGSYIDRNQSAHSDINENFSGFRDPIIDRGFRVGSGTYNNAVRARAYGSVQAEVNKQAYWIGLYYGDAIATSDGRVKGFANNPTTAGVAWNGYAWHR